MGLVKNYELGQGGVNVDASPAHAAQNELLQAQNAIVDPLGVGGGLTNRPGLTKFNASALSGAVKGGVSGAAFNLVSARTLYLAEVDGSGNEYWYTSSDLFATSSRITTMADWQDPTEYYAEGGQVCRMGVFFNGQIYYASTDYTVGSQSPNIRAFNGVDDRKVTKVLPTTTKGITGMIASKGYMYVLTLDSGTSDADYVGRVFRVFENGQFEKIGDTLPTGYVPTALTVVSGIIYVGVSRSTSTNEARVYRIDPLDETTWTLDQTLSADDWQITDMASFGGLLYLTTKNGGGATKGKVYQRSISGTYTAVDSTSNNTGSYEGLAVFEGYLYASSRNYSTTTNTAVIRRSADGSTWATVYNSSSATGVGHLQVVGTYLFSLGNTGMLYTTSGTSFTAATPAGTGNCGRVIGTLVRSGAAAFHTPIVTSTTPTPQNVTNNVTTTQGDSIEDWGYRKWQRWWAITGTTVDQIGLGTLGTQGTLASDSAAATDAIYARFNSSGVSGTNCGIINTSGKTSKLGYATSTYPLVFTTRVRTHDTNQAKWLVWAGLYDGTAGIDDTSFPAGVNFIGFRWVKTTAGSSADDGNWYFIITDGSSLLREIDTAVPIVGGTASGACSFELSFTYDGTTVTWTITNITSSTTTTGTTTLNGFTTTTPLAVHVAGSDATGAVKSFRISSIFVGHR